MNVDLTGLQDPTYNEPVTGYEVNGLYFRVTTNKRCCAWVEFKNIQEAKDSAERLRLRIERYQKLIDAAGVDEETNMAIQYIGIAKRHLEIYERIYIPVAQEWENKRNSPVEIPKIEALVTSEAIEEKAVVELQPELVNESKGGQISLF